MLVAAACELSDARLAFPGSSEMLSEMIRSSNNQSIDYSIHKHTRLEYELKGRIELQVALGTPSSDADIQAQSRLIVYQNDDPWNQTVVHDPAVLRLVKQQTGLIPSDIDGTSGLQMPMLSKDSETETPSPARTLQWDLEGNPMVVPIMMVVRRSRHCQPRRAAPACTSSLGPPSSW